MIKLEFSDLTVEQAHHILEAHQEAMGFTANTPLMDKIEELRIKHAEPVITVEQASNEDIAAIGKFDNRGVPFHADHHSPRLKEDGSWARRRGHDRLAADSYEARYLGNGVAPQAAPQTVATTPPVSMTPPVAETMPSFDAPLVRCLPTVEEFKAKWVDLCHKQLVSGEHQKFIEKQFGGHPCAPEIMANEENRRQIWVIFENWANGIKGF